MSKSQEMIDAWGAKTYPAHAGKKFSFTEDTRSSGYCETCWSEWDVLEVRADGEVVDTFSEVTVLEMMTRIMDAQ